MFLNLLCLVKYTNDIIFENIWKSCYEKQRSDRDILGKHAVIAHGLGKDMIAKNAAIKDDSLTRAQQVNTGFRVLMIAQFEEVYLHLRRPER